MTFRCSQLTKHSLVTVIFLPSLGPELQVSLFPPWERKIQGTEQEDLLFDTTKTAASAALSLCHIHYSGEFSIELDCLPQQSLCSILASPVYTGWHLGLEQFWMNWEEKRQDFYYNALFITGSIWSMSNCQICNIIWEPADGAVTDSIQRFVYSPEHVLPSWGKYRFIVQAVGLFVPRCWTRLSLGPRLQKRKVV